MNSASPHTNPDPQSEIIRAASSHGIGWVKVRDLWQCERVRTACGANGAGGAIQRPALTE